MQRVLKSVLAASSLLENPANARQATAAQPDDMFFISLFAAFFLAGLVLMTLAIR
jgi:hypothetical protein